MNNIKRKVKIAIMGGLLTLGYSASYGQEYYSSPNSYRRGPANPPPKDKDKDENDSRPSGYLSINIGFTTPEGSFANPFPQSSYSLTGQVVGTGYGGYAQSGGLIYDFSLGIPIHHSNFGIAAMFASYNNNYDIGSYVTGLNNSNLGYQTQYTYTNSSNTQTTISPTIVPGDYSVAPSANQYSFSSIMGGLFTTYPVGRLSIDGRLMIGALLGSLPEQDVYAYDNYNDGYQFDLQQSNSVSLAFDAGIGARFLIAQFWRRKLCAMVNVDYLYSKVSYNTQQVQYFTPGVGPDAGFTGQAGSPEVTGSFPVQLLNVTFGLGYQI